MAPANTQSTETTLRSRSKISWNGKTVLRTDRHGPQEQYAEAVEDWSSNHDLLSHIKFEKNSKNVCKTILRFRLHSRARDLV